MPLDLDQFKGKTLDDATLSALQSHVAAHVDPLEARVTKSEDKARKAAQESIDGRKGKDARIERMAELLGIDVDADLDKLEPAKGLAEAKQQVEAKVRKLERDISDKAKAFDELGARYRKEQRERVITSAVSKHQFIDAEDAAALLAARVREEGEDFVFALPDGKTASVEEGAAWLAKTKTHLVRPAGGDGGKGSGFNGGAAGRQGGGKTMTEAEFQALQPKQRAERMAEGYQLIEV